MALKFYGRAAELDEEKKKKPSQVAAESNKQLNQKTNNGLKFYGRAAELKLPERPKQVVEQAPVVKEEPKKNIFQRGFEAVKNFIKPKTMEELPSGTQSAIKKIEPKALQKTSNPFYEKLDSNVSMESARPTDEITKKIGDFFQRRSAGVEERVIMAERKLKDLDIQMRAVEEASKYQDGLDEQKKILNAKIDLYKKYVSNPVGDPDEYVEINLSKKDLPEGYKEHGVLGQLYDGFLQGSNQILSSIMGQVESIGGQIDSVNISEFGQRSKLYFEKKLAENPEWQAPTDMKKWDNPVFYARLVGEGVPSILGSVAVGVLAAAATVATGGTATAASAISLGSSFVYGYLSEGGSATKEAIDYGLSKDEAAFAGNSVGAINGLVESIPMFGWVGGSIGKEAAQEVATKVTGSITKRLIGEAKKRGYSSLAGFFEEGTQEALQEVINNAVAMSYNEDRSLWDGVLEAFAAGGILGGASSIVKSDVKAEFDKKRASEVQEQIKDETIEPSVLQIIDQETNEMEYKTIAKGELESFKNAIDTTDAGIAGKNINGKTYHLTAFSPEQIEKRGFKFTGQANLSELPSSSKTDKPQLLEQKEFAPIKEIMSQYQSAADFAKTEGTSEDRQIGIIDSSLINPRDEVDQNTESFKNLENDIKVNGVREPVIVQVKEDGSIETTEGSHRVTAALKNGLKVPVIVTKGSIDGLSTIKEVFSANKTQVKQEVTQEPTPTKTEEKADNTTLNKYYSEQDQDKIGQALYEVTAEMEVAEAGKKVFSDYGEYVGSQESTFPDWIPEDLRSRKLFDSVLSGLSNLNDIKYPPNSQPRKQALYDAILDELDSRAGIDSSDIRLKIKEQNERQVKETKSKTKPKTTVDRSPKGSKRTEITKEVAFEDRLISEAKKYESVEEFIKAQGDPLFHGTTKKFKTFDLSKAGTRNKADQGFAGKGIYLTNSKEVAKTFSKGKDIFKTTDGVETETIIEAYLDKNTKILKVSDFTELEDKLGLPRSKDRPSNVGLTEFISQQAPLKSKKAKEMGYGAVQVDGGGKDASGIDVFEIVVFDTKDIKTKAELVDIYNKYNDEKETKVDVLAEDKNTTQKANNKSQVSVVEIDKETVEPVESSGKLKKSTAFTKVQDRLQDIYKGDVFYNEMNLANNAARALDFIEKFPERALRIARGLENSPNGFVTDTAISIAMAEQALKDKNYELQAELEKILSLRGTRGGQETVSFRGRFNDHSPHTFINRVLKARLELANKVYFSYKKFKRVVETIDQKANNVQKYVNKETLDKLESAQKILDDLTC